MSNEVKDSEIEQDRLGQDIISCIKYRISIIIITRAAISYIEIHTGP